MELVIAEAILPVEGDSYEAVAKFLAITTKKLMNAYAEETM